MTISSVHDARISLLTLHDRTSRYDLAMSESHSPMLKVNNTKFESLPYRNDRISVEKLSSKTLVMQFFGGKVTWIHSESTIYVNVEPVLRGKTFGLCGTFNFYSHDDFQTLDNDVESNVNSFVYRFADLASCSAKNVFDSNGTVTACEKNFKKDSFSKKKT